MANPAVISIPTGQWVKVADAVTAGSVVPLQRDANYLQTYRVAADPAPTNEDYTDALELDKDGLIIQAPVAIDVYVCVTGSAVGKVRVDL